MSRCYAPRARDSPRSAPWDAPRALSRSSLMRGPHSQQEQRTRVETERVDEQCQYPVTPCDAHRTLVYDAEHLHKN